MLHPTVNFLYCWSVQINECRNNGLFWTIGSITNYLVINMGAHSTVLTRTSDDGDVEQSNTSCRVWPDALESARGGWSWGDWRKGLPWFLCCRLPFLNHFLVSLSEKTNLHLSLDTTPSPHFFNVYQTQDSWFLCCSVWIPLIVDFKCFWSLSIWSLGTGRIALSFFGQIPKKEETNR